MFYALFWQHIVEIVKFILPTIAENSKKLKRLKFLATQLLIYRYTQQIQLTYLIILGDIYC